MPARRLLSIVLAALTLTACSPDAPLIDAPPSPVTAEPVAQPLELGDFDPEGDFEVFNPCTEIPADVRAAAGLGEPVRDPAYDGDRSVRCSFYPLHTSSQGFYSLTGDRVPLSRIEERGLLLSPTADSTLPGVYLHHMGSGVPDECSAAVHTNRGRFIVQFTEISSTQGRDVLCALSIEKLESIYHHWGENNGDVDRS
ncbi:DUF3558 domain-containing protein [Corynebacterium comes]|uniref:DUF3558 domain-containing protein n=1 Tax=Corynebacterium comes TaxID=2675218 RepID=A0A6B8VIN2_9CORY|nr:DUF3558 domain-containing protein [Corynebacterium comes]QGU05212.1 hypothetical protein CETAM_09815 [Corynebacterium comes]